MKQECKYISIKKIMININNEKIYLKPDIEANFDDKKELDLSNESDRDLIQRNYIWNNSQRQNIIETIFEGLFIPTVVVYEKDDNYNEKHKYSLIDGKQRINTIWMYYKNKFKYDKGTINKNKKFNELNEEEKDKFEQYKIPIIILKELEVDELKTIFETLNINSTKLKPQEIRHAIYNNALTKEINKMHSFSSQNNNLNEDDVIDLFLKTSLFNYKKLFDRTLDEFIVKLMRLFTNENGGILDDSKKNLDIYYKNLSENPEDLFLSKNNKTSKNFFSLLTDVLKFYNNLENLIPKEIKKPIIIYIIFYFSMEINEDDFVIDFENLDIVKWKEIFEELNKNDAFNKAIRNQNNKKNKTIMIEKFKNTYLKNLTM